MTVTSHDIANAIAEYRTLPGENWSRLASDIQRAIDANGHADEEAQWERMIAYFDRAGPSVVDGTGWAEAAFNTAEGEHIKPWRSLGTQKYHLVTDVMRGQGE